jgi:hypothetical protein
MFFRKTPAVMENGNTNLEPKKKKRWRKVLLRFAGGLLAFFVLVLVFLSPIAKYLIEKYDVRYTGREIRVDQAFINPFTGYIYLIHPKIYEVNSDSFALTAKVISADISLRKLFSKMVDMGTVRIDQPDWFIVQKGSKHDLNFKDLIERFSSDPNDTTPPSTHFRISSLKITKGRFFYYEDQTPVRYFIKNVDITSSPIGWGTDTIAFNYSFFSGIKTGSMKGVFTINVNNLDYRLNADVVKYDLQMMEQYLKSLSNYGSFRANFDAKIRSKGSLRDARNLKVKGSLVINDLHFGKDSLEDYASFTKLSTNIISLQPGNKKYIFDTIVLTRPFFQYERYDHLDNFQTIFGKGGSRVVAASNNNARFNLILEIAGYVEKLSKDFFRSYYRINKVKIEKANFVYVDYALNEKFEAATDPLFVEADSIDKRRTEVKVKLHTAIKPYGNMVLDLKVNPQDSSNFDLVYRLEKFPLAMFNPYLVTYTSYPLNRGTMEVKGFWKVRDGMIQSTNHLIIVDPRIANRVKGKENKWIPLPLIMPLVRERSNVVDYEIPITGSLKKPKLHPKDAILDLLKNIVMNPPTTPYRMEVKKTEREIEKSLTLHWEIGQEELNKAQCKFLYKIADFLEETPGTSVSVYPIEYADREKEHILFFEAKKKFYKMVNNLKEADFNEEDSMAVCKMPLRDSTFIRQLDKCCDKGLVFTMQDKCTQYVEKGLVEKKYALLQKKRVQAFVNCFKENDTQSRVKLHAGKYEIPYNGFSYFRIRYNGEFPEYLAEAYDKMNAFNNEEPRLKYKNKRRKSVFTR